MAKVSPEGKSHDNEGKTSSGKKKLLFSIRLFQAGLLFLCYVGLSITSSNLSVTIVSMVRETPEITKTRLLANVSRIRRNLNGSKLLNFDELFGVETKEINDINSTIISVGNFSSEITQCSASRITKRATEYVEKINNGVTDIPHDSSDDVTIENCNDKNKVSWSPLEQGLVFAGQNFGSLFQILSGMIADRYNSKWLICGGLVLLIISNFMIPSVAAHFYLVMFARMIGGLGDSIISPSASSLLGRWFPTKERSLIQTLVGAGRQVGSLIIFPTAGYLSNKSGGWPLAFYVSGGIVAIILFAWFVFSADKPSKSRFISDNEIKFIEERLAVGEKHGKRTERKKTPWKQILKNKAVWMGTMALVCHEFPLVITMTLIPRYLKDILKFESGGMLGLLSFLPTGSIFLSKVICMAISGYVTKKKKGHSSGAPTKVAKIFNFFASLGLGLCLCIIPLLSNPNHSTYCMIVLCLGCFFAGLHSFGVCAALLTIAPAYSGIVNGIAYTVVAIFSIINKLGSYYILQTGAPWEWNLIFLTSGVVALLPCFFFTLWGSADIQPFAIKREGSVTGSAITGSSSISSLSRSNSKTNVGGRPPPLKISPSISSNISEKFNFENNLGANSTPTSRLPSCNMEIPLTPKPKTPPKIVVQDDDADLEHN